MIKHTDKIFVDTVITVPLKLVLKNDDDFLLRIRMFRTRLLRVPYFSQEVTYSFCND